MWDATRALALTMVEQRIRESRLCSLIDIQHLASVTAETSLGLFPWNVPGCGKVRWCLVFESFAECDWR